MHAEIDRIVQDLPRLGIQERIDERLALDDVEFVVALARAAATAHGGDHRLVTQCLRAILARPVSGKVAAALEVVAVMRPPKARARRIATWLAESLKHEEAVAAFGAAGVAGPIADELRGCLLHELIVRGVVIAEHDQLMQWATSPHWAWHPLRVLPLERMPLEHIRPSHTVGSGALPSTINSAPLRIPAAIETTTSLHADQVRQAVANWQQESNGRSEARAFTLDHLPAPDAVTALLGTLALECLRCDHGATADLTVTESTPADVWSILFAAAADGGAYNTGEGAAYGRLYAWRSLGALCGAGEFDAVDHIARLAADARWFTFAATTAWFERVAWDIGIAALTPEPGVTVLAATDTD
ncbi:DUF6183 family protein [Nocardia sp. NPDC004415]